MTRTTKTQPPAMAAALALASLLLLTSCPEDPQHICGNGVIEVGEDCDGYDLGGFTCMDVTGSNGGGQLRCGEHCVYDIAGCGHPPCGSATVEFGEDCDCGNDPENLPSGCLDINGGPNANCSLSCESIPVCGDGVVQLGERCDCGALVELLSPDCSALNGEPGSECSLSCEWAHGPCEAELGEGCDPQNAAPCCPDAWAEPTVCATALAEPALHCSRECGDTQDCYFSYECSEPAGGICTVSRCGPGFYYDRLHDFCAVEGGGPGWCVPFFDRTQPDATPLGVCVERGTLAPGEDCAALPGPLELDRSGGACDAGLCVPDEDNPFAGSCAQFCDWETAYDAAFHGGPWELLPCPANHDCASLAQLDPVSGVRVRDIAYCVRRGSASYSCSLVTGNLLSDPTATCADVISDSRCVLRTTDDGLEANGSLLGVCLAGQAATRSTWDTCDPAVDICPESTRCEAEDFFATAPAGPSRCLPLCDAAYDTAPGDCAALGAGDASAICLSLSARFAPTDVSPTRLGLCALP